MDQEYELLVWDGEFKEEPSYCTFKLMAKDCDEAITLVNRERSKYLSLIHI